MSTPFTGRSLVIATMHGKEKVILPAVEKRLGVRCQVPAGLNTDLFGTFTGEIPRPGNPLETARHKVMAALDRTGASLGIASEGSFGPHPAIPFVATDTELLLLIDREKGLEIAAQEISTDTNYDHQVCCSLEETDTFARQVLFPSHALIVYGGSPSRKDLVTKGITDFHQLRQAAAAVLERHGEVMVETDMRAHLNPTRMTVIAKATEALLHKLTSLCPACDRPGFTPNGKIPGLPCAWCGTPTSLPLAIVTRCDKCGYSHENKFPSGATKSDPAFCDQCNP